MHDVRQADCPTEEHNPPLADRTAAARHVDVRDHARLREACHQQSAERRKQVERREGNMRGTARMDHAIADIPSPHAIGLEEIAHVAANAAAMAESPGGNDGDVTGTRHNRVPRCTAYPGKVVTSHV